MTVILILAHRVDPALCEKLYDLVCKQCGDEDKDCVVPCVVDLEQRACVFNCCRIPYVGFGYAVKNRGIRIIKRCVFGSNFNLQGNESLIESVKDYSPEDTLWKVWKMVQQEAGGTDRKNKKRFGMMADREIRLADDLLYLKWGESGVCLPVELDEQEKQIKVTLVTKWTYPKTQLIAQKVRQKMKEHILDYCVQRDYTVEFAEEKPWTQKS